MSWFNTSGFATLAKSALNQAQKTIDKALDIQNDTAVAVEKPNQISTQPSKSDDAADSFFASFGLVEGGPSVPRAQTQSPKSGETKIDLKAEKQTGSIWGSFTGSFFDPGSMRNEPLHGHPFESRFSETSTETIAAQPQKRVHQERSRTFSLGESEEDRERNASIEPRKTPVLSLLRTSESVSEIFEASLHQSDSCSLPANTTREGVIPTKSECKEAKLSIENPAEFVLDPIQTSIKDQGERDNSSSGTKSFNSDTWSDDNSSDVKSNRVLGKVKRDGSVESCLASLALLKSYNEEVSEHGDILQDIEAVNLLLCDHSSLQEPPKDNVKHLPSNVENVTESEVEKMVHCPKEETGGSQISPWSSAWEVQSVESITNEENKSFIDNKELQERLSECSILPAEDFKTSLLSFMSASSSSTTGESSSTLDESVGTISALSEKEIFSSRHSSTTLTPEVFSDSGDTAMPVGMSSSWDLGDSSGEHVALQHVVITDNTDKVQNVANAGEVNSGTPHECDLDDTLTEESNANIGTLIDLQMVEITKKDEEGLGIEEIGDKVAGLQSCDEKDNGSPTNSSLLSFMIEDAMVESVNNIGRPMISSNRAYSPNSTASSTSSNAERSDPVKTTESEQNSGQTSGDEIETTTSSDIEIISSPSIGGESGCERRGSISPVKPSSVWRNKHSSGACSSRYHVPSSMRSESPASDTSSTKDCLPIQFGTAPARPNLSFTSVVPSKSKHQRNVSEASSEESDQARIEALMKKVAEMTSVLEAREAKVLDLSHENMELREKNSTLKGQLRKAEEVHAADTRDVSSFTKELTERLSNTEKKMQLALREKEALKRDLQEATIEIASRVSAAQVEEIKNEKDTQIAELMQEGESLSKKVLQYSNNVKKLRAKEKDNENHIKQQREKIEEQSRELDRIRKALGAKEEVEKNQIELIRQLTNNMQKNEKEITALKSDLEDAHEKQKSMKFAMESAYKELAELHRKNAEQDSKAQEAVLSAEITAKEELRMTLEKLQHESRLQQDGLVFQIEDLQLTLSRSEQQAGQREDALRQDIANLQQRLQDSEGRNDELNQNVSAATQPLLRQIDNLQATLNIQTSSWERIERNLTDRLTEAQNQLAHANEKERAIAEKYADLGAKVASLEAKNSLVRQEKARLQALLDTSTTDLQLLKESKEKETVMLDSLKRNFKERIASLQRERDMLDHQLEIEKTALEAEKRKTALLQDQLKENELRLSKQSYNLEGSRGSSPGSRSNMSMRGSFSDNFQSSWYQEDAHESGIMFPTTPTSRMNVYETLRAGSMSTLLDSLQSQLKLRDGDIVQLQNDIAQLERVKESMTEELVKLNARIEELEVEIGLLKEQETNFQDMGQKYNALLQMYGEKIEEAEELRLDLQDVKDMYKAQIDDLLRRK